LREFPQQRILQVALAEHPAAVQVQVDAARRFLRCEHAQRDLAGPAGDEQFACPGQ
jgi:hypothetical protein